MGGGGHIEGDDHILMVFTHLNTGEQRMKPRHVIFFEVPIWSSENSVFQHVNTWFSDVGDVNSWLNGCLLFVVCIQANLQTTLQCHQAWFAGTSPVDGGFRNVSNSMLHFPANHV